MAGEGRRFVEKGYTFPKPLIEGKCRPMIQLVVQNLTPRTDHRFTFICRQEHYDKYNLHGLLRLIAPGCNMIPIEGTTAGAACTVLLAKEFMDNDDPMVIANSDQFVHMDINSFYDNLINSGRDGSILTFKATHPKWSFARVNPEGVVVEVAEKNPISDNATVGIYGYRRGADFVESAENMIKKNMRVNNEFYVCPVYNEMILAGKTIDIHPMPQGSMHGLGTPEDLERFLQSPVYQTLA